MLGFLPRHGEEEIGRMVFIQQAVEDGSRTGQESTGSEMPKRRQQPSLNRPYRGRGFWRRGLRLDRTSNGVNTIHGGSGDALIVLGEGQDAVFTGSGRNQIQCWGGTNQIIIDHGINDIAINGGKIKLRFERTGLHQTVRGFSGGKIDLSDRSVLGKIEITSKENGDTIFIRRT